MRLRLTVRRHSLPDCPIIWDVNTSTSSPTVSELLDQINDVIPIESAEWGMEDYAVEVKGKEGVNYECLHFQPVGKVMKEEDEVIIRPLLTHDLRERRISGRHQISSDGKHLVDGVAFGRPRLKRPANRPAIAIPPRKRRRITIDEDDEENEDVEDAELEVKRITFQPELEDEDDEDDDDFEPDGDDEEEDEESDEEAEDTSSRQLVLRADFEDDDDDDDDDENFEPGFGEEEESEESEEAFEGFQDDQPTSSTLGDSRENSGNIGDLSKANQAVLSGVKNASTKAKICKLHMAFPKASIAVVKYVLEGSDGDVSHAYEALARGYVAARPKSFILQVSSSDSKLPQPSSKSQISTNSEAETTSKHTDPTPVMGLDDEESGSEGEEEDILLQHYDQHGLPSGSINSGKALSFMAEAMGDSANPKSKLTKFATSSTRNNGTNVTKGDLSSGFTSTAAINLKLNDDEINVNSDSSSDSSSEAESSSGDDSSSDNSGDSSSEEDSSEAADASSSSDSESDSDSDSSSDSSSDDADEAPEVKSSKLAVPMVETANSKPIPSTDIVLPKSQTPVPPRQGKKATHARNQRRKQGMALAKFKEQGILPKDTTVSEFSRLEISESTSPEDAFAALSVLRANTNSAKIQNRADKALTEAEEFDARRRELLASLSSGGIEVSPRSGKAVVDTIDVDVPEMVSGAPKTGKDTPKETAADFEMAEVRSQEDANPVATNSGKPVSSSRQAKLDVGAGRRLLFGALGMKNPKTKKDEDELRNDLMKGVRVPKTANPSEEPSAQQIDTPAIDDESWRDKIVYRAVECCQDGIILSEPPFPFVQRWDPQQQIHRGGKRKSQDQAYTEESKSSKKRKGRKGKRNYSEEQEYWEESYQPSYDEDAIATQSTEPPARQVESVEHRADIGDLIQETPDLVELPEDPTTLPNLVASAVESGMIIAFKQMLVNETTRWQPQISAYRTASVLSVKVNGDISVALARRDRDRPVKHYDENGQRVWGKFEMPDDNDEDEEEEDNGEMTVAFNDLIEAKIVALAPVSLSTDISKTGMTADESVTLSNGKEEETQCSHVTETQYFDTSAPVSAEIVDVADTPHNSNLEYLQAGSLPKSITDGAKEDISHLIEEAGFRSNVPSIVRDFAHHGLEKRDEVPTVENLKTKTMAEIDEVSFSPKFNGFGSNSPARQQQPTTSPDRQQSSWNTVESQEPSSAPAQDKPEVMEAREFETTAQKDVSTNILQAISDAPSIHTRPRSNKINVDKAQAIWEVVQPQGKAASPIESDLTLDTIEVDCRGADPKFSAQSSFTSLVTDHGRQLDFSFENMRNQEIDTFKTDNVTVHDSDMFEDGPEFPPLRKNSSSRSAEKNNAVDPSSEDFPTIEEMLSQPSQSLMKHEKSASQPPSKSQAAAEKSRRVLAAFVDTQSSATKNDEKSKKVLTAFDDSDSDSDTRQIKTEVQLKREAEIKSKRVMAAFDPSSDEEDQIAPKASKPSNPHPAQNRTFKVPQSSQAVMDLTLSSDVELESDKGKSKSKDSDGGDDSEVGWGAKTKSNLRGLKRQGSNNLGGTTNASLNTKTSKRTF